MSAPGLPLCVKSQRVMYVLIKLTHRVSARECKPAVFLQFFLPNQYLCVLRSSTLVSVSGDSHQQVR